VSQRRTPIWLASFAFAVSIALPLLVTSQLQAHQASVIRLHQSGAQPFPERGMSVRHGLVATDSCRCQAAVDPDSVCYLWMDS